MVTPAQFESSYRKRTPVGSVRLPVGTLVGNAETSPRQGDAVKFSGEGQTKQQPVKYPWLLDLSGFIDRLAPQSGGLIKTAAIVLERWAKGEPLQLIEHGKVLLPNGYMANKALVLAGDRIKAVLDSSIPGFLIGNKDVVRVDAKDKLVTPGLVDQHMHGGFGLDFNTPSPEKIKNLLRRLPAFGVTGIVPSIMTASNPAMRKACNTIESMFNQPNEGARMLGIHLEGPFLNKGFRGAHPEKRLLSPTLANANGLLTPHLKIMTLAPELDDANFSFIRHLVSRGVRVSAGHSAASYEEIKRAKEAGVTGITHLYNAMKPFHHRDSSIVNAALTLPGLRAEMIADGVHVKPETLASAINGKRLEDLILITDSLALAGMPEGSKFSFGGQPVKVHNGKAVNQEGNLAGSTIFLDSCVRNLVSWKLASFPAAITMASQNPADNLGFGSSLGKIAPGYLADLVLWNLDHTVQKTLIAGHQAYPSTSRQG